MQPADQRQEIREAWSASAAGWAAQADDFADDTLPVAMWMVEAVQPHPGDTILELAAGPGDTGFLAAELIEPGGQLLSTDWVPEMVDAARGRAEKLGIRNARFRQEDAQSLTLGAASVDGVLCRFGYMLMPDGAAALRETRRVLRPGRRVALAVWKPAEQNPWMSLLRDQLVRRGWTDPPRPGAPGPFSWAEEGEVAERLRQAGFVELSVEGLQIECSYPSFDGWLDTTRQMSNVTRTALSGRSAEEIDDLRADLRQAAEPYLREDGRLVFPGNVWVAWAAA